MKKQTCLLLLLAITTFIGSNLSCMKREAIEANRVEKTKERAIAYQTLYNNTICPDILVIIFTFIMDCNNFKKITPLNEVCKYWRSFFIDPEGNPNETSITRILSPYCEQDIEFERINHFNWETLTSFDLLDENALIETIISSSASDNPYFLLALLNNFNLINEMIDTDSIKDLIAPIGVYNTNHLGDFGSIPREIKFKNHENPGIVYITLLFNLLKHDNFEINQQLDNNKMTLLHLASKLGSSEPNQVCTKTLNLLFDCGADQNIKNSYGMHPLTYCIPIIRAQEINFEGLSNCIMIFINHGFILDQPITNQNETLLHLIVSNPNPYFALNFFNQYIDVSRFNTHVITTQEVTPLHNIIEMAFRYNFVPNDQEPLKIDQLKSILKDENIYNLIEKSTSIEEPLQLYRTTHNDNDVTNFTMTIASLIVLFKKMVLAGANLEATDSDGLTALDYLRNNELKNFMQNYLNN